MFTSRQSDGSHGLDVFLFYSLKAINAAPGFRTWYLNKSKNILKKTINALKFVISKVKKYKMNHFDSECYVADIIQCYKNALSVIHVHVKDILHFKCNDDNSNNNNLFSNFKEQREAAGVPEEECNER